MDASEAIATRLVGAIAVHFEPLRHIPLIGPGRDHLAPGLRVTFHKPYAVYYMPSDDAVTVVRVIHDARDIDAIAERGGFT